VSTLTIGKTIAESLNSITTKKINARIGVLVPTLTITEKAAHLSITVCRAMVGKNKSIIQRVINLVCVNMGSNVVNLIAPIFTMIKTEDHLYKYGSRSFPRLESLTSLLTITCLISET
jgi:hypothetical protein